MESRVTAFVARVAGFGAAVVVLLVGVFACEPGRVVNPEAFLSEMNHDLGTPAFAAASARPFVSELDPHPSVRLWVSAEVADDYAAIRPDRAGSGVVLSPGTMIVREVLGTDGRVAKLTVMAKGPDGYNPAVGDWWFAVTSPAGVPLADDAGAALVGKIAACVKCHEDRKDDDHLFGVPLAARVAASANAH
jgi:hypothetical protein